MEVIQFNGMGKYNWIPLDKNKVLYLIIHHIDAKTATPSQIDDWHFNGNGWSGGFGYNEYIRKDGTVYIGRGDNIGAQCANMNSKSYGIALEGNYNVESEIPKAQFDSLIARLQYNKKRFPNFIKIAPHSEFVQTDCPGKYVNMERIINTVNGINSQLDLDLQLLGIKSIISTPSYWQNNAIKDKTCRGEFVASLINNIAEYIRKRG